MAKKREISPEVKAILEKWKDFVDVLEHYCHSAFRERFPERPDGIHVPSLRYICSLLPSFFSDEKVRNLFGFYFTVASHPNLNRFADRYMELLYLSKDLEFFKNLLPADAARYARWYLGRKGHRIDQRYFPYLLKVAQRVRQRLQLRMFRLKKSHPELPEEGIFDIMKRKYRPLLVTPRSKKEAVERSRLRRRKIALPQEVLTDLKEIVRDS